MRNYKIALIIVSTLIVGGGLGFVITGFATSGNIEDSFAFLYEPSSPDPIEDLSINTDIGKTIIKYNTTSTPYYAKIDVDLKIAGLFMSGKTYLNFFKLSTEWWDESTAAFYLKILPDVWFDPSHWFKSYDIIVTLTLRTDITYKIDAITTIGSINIDIPKNVIMDDLFLTTTTGSVSAYATGVNLTKGITCATSTGSLAMNLTNCLIEGDITGTATTGSVSTYVTGVNLTKGITYGTTTGSLIMSLTNCIIGGNVKGTATTGSVSAFMTGVNLTKGIACATTTGSLTMNLTNSIIGDDITGTVTTGRINFKSYNLEYTQDIVWDLETTTGSIDIQFYQYKEMGANITGDITATTGSIEISYRDNLINTGVRFVGTTNVGSVDYVSHSTMEISGSVYSSVNYGTANNKYLFTLTTSTGSIDVDSQSVIHEKLG